MAHRNESGRRRSGHDEGQPDPVSMHIQVTGDPKITISDQGVPAYGIEFPSMLMSKLQATMAVTGSVELRLTG